MNQDLPTCAFGNRCIAEIANITSRCERLQSVRGSIGIFEKCVKRVERRVVARVLYVCCTEEQVELCT